MKFLRIILIGSLTVSAASPCYGLSFQPLYNWWNSVSKHQKILGVGLLVWGATICYILKDYWGNKKLNLIRDIVKSPVQVDNAKEQQEREIKQLRSIISSGYHLTTDSNVHDDELHDPSISFLMYAIDSKPYLIPLLKELGATPDLIRSPNALTPHLYCLKAAAKSPCPEAFDTLAKSYPLSQDEWNTLIEHVASIDLSTTYLARIIPTMPATLVNKAYNFYRNGQKTLLLHITDEAIRFSLNNLENINYTSLIQHLIDKGADPLIPDATGKTILNLLAANIDNSVERKAVKKQLKGIIMPVVKRKKEMRADTINDAIGALPSEVINICSDYEYDTDGEYLLELLGNEKQSEKAILSELNSIIKPGVPLSTYAYVINKADASGATPLMYAATRGHCSVAKYLMDHGADYEACDKKDCNVLRHAAYHGQSAVIRTVLEQAKKDRKLTPRLIDKQDNYWGETPLINAIRTSSSPKKVTAKMKEDTVRVLLEYGADTTLQSFNRNAESYAHGGMMEDEHGVADTGARARIIAMLQNPPRLATDIPPAASPGLGLDVTH